MFRPLLTMILLWMTKVLFEAYYHFVPNDAIARLSEEPQPAGVEAICPHCHQEVHPASIAVRSKSGEYLHRDCAVKVVERLATIRVAAMFGVVALVAGLMFAATALSNSKTASRVQTDQAQQAIIWWLAHSPENKTLPPATVALWGPLKKKPKWGYTMEVTYQRAGATPETTIFDLDQDFRRVRPIGE